MYFSANSVPGEVLLIAKYVTDCFIPQEITTQVESLYQ